MTENTEASKKLAAERDALRWELDRTGGVVTAIANVGRLAGLSDIPEDDCQAAEITVATFDNERRRLRRQLIEATAALEGVVRFIPEDQWPGIVTECREALARLHVMIPKACNDAGSKDHVHRWIDIDNEVFRGKWCPDCNAVKPLVQRHEDTGDESNEDSSVV